MTLKGGIVASVHTTVTSQAFNRLKHGILGVFVRTSKRGRGSLCLSLKGNASLRGEDTYVRLRHYEFSSLERTLRSLLP